jgi:hypothetical protein
LKTGQPPAFRAWLASRGDFLSKSIFSRFQNHYLKERELDRANVSTMTRHLAATVCDLHDVEAELELKLIELLGESLLDISQKEIVDRARLNYNGILPPKNLSQLREYIEKHPSETQRMLGREYDQLIQLITHAENLYARQKKSQESQKTRLIKPGSGIPPKLTIADQIILTLVYLHHLPTFQILGVQFDYRRINR